MNIGTGDAANHGEIFGALAQTHSLDHQTPTVPVDMHAPSSNSELILREATAADVSAVAPVFDAYRAFYGAPHEPAATRSFLQARHQRGDSILIVAVHSDAMGGTETVVGFTHLYPSFSSVSLRRVFILNDLFVLPAWRRARVARQLVGHGVACANAHGAIRLELATQHSNVPAQRLYHDLGFKPDLTFTHMSLDLPATRTP